MANSKIIEGLYYTEDHEWLQKLDGNIARIGITDYAQHALGDVVFVELPQIGRKLTMKESFGVIESVKAASDLFAPVSGEVAQVNSEINTAPDSVNNDPYQKGWMIEITLSNPVELDQLMNSAAYTKFVEDLEKE